MLNRRTASLTDIWGALFGREEASGSLWPSGGHHFPLGSAEVDDTA